jgi:membrane protease YdiL (CAAX protease family)
MEVPYSSIASTKPHHLRRCLFKRGPIRFWQAILFAVITTGLFLFSGQYILRLVSSPQLANMLAELIFFVIAGVLFILLMGNRLSNVLPFRKPKPAAVGGIFVLLFAFFLSAQTVSILTYWLFPRQMLSASRGMNASFLTGDSVFLTLVSTTAAPAISEEILHRGIIFRGLRNSFRSRKLIIALTAVIFGVFHIQPVRWSMPMMLGAVAAWIMLETDNIFYTMLLHFLYNFTLIGISLLTTRLSPVNTAALLGNFRVSAATAGSVLLFYGIPVPLLLYTGLWLIRRSEAVYKPPFALQGKQRKTLLQIIVPTFIILCVGLVLIFAGAVTG